MLASHGAPLAICSAGLLLAGRVRAHSGASGNTVDVAREDVYASTSHAHTHTAMEARNATLLPKYTGNGCIHAHSYERICDRLSHCSVIM